jgi:hypothetical protein
MPDKDTSTGQGSPEYDELLKDLNQYDNPEAFYNANASQLYSFRVNSTARDDLPEILQVELNGANVFQVTREMILGAIKKGSQQVLESGELNWGEERARLIADTDYLQAEREAYWFFVRNLPHVVLKVL